MYDEDVGITISHEVDPLLPPVRNVSVEIAIGEAVAEVSEDDMACSLFMVQ